MRNQNFASRLLISLSTALCCWRNATNVRSLSRAASAALFFPRLGITTVGTYRVTAHKRLSVAFGPPSTKRRFRQR